ncbi:MAG: low molecular weight phosphatase family protein [Nitrospiraceae bacterium]
MSRLLFLCSGNTCRSPMASGIARRVFGPSHRVMSAGAETGSGEAAAQDAIAAMSELGVDISSHCTVDIADLDLTSFDLIVVFRPVGG